MLAAEGFLREKNTKGQLIHPETGITCYGGCKNFEKDGISPWNP